MCATFHLFQELDVRTVLNALHKAPPRFYLTAMEKHREKAWDQNYVMDWKWWTLLVQSESMLRTDRVHHFQSVT